MTLQIRLFTGLLAAASSVAASSEQQQQRSTTFSLSVNTALNKRLSSARERNLKRMQLFTKSLGMFEWLQLSSIPHPHPHHPHSAPVCQSVSTEIWEGLKD